MKKIFPLLLFCSCFFSYSQKETKVHFDLLQTGTYSLNTSQNNVKVFYDVFDYIDYHQSLSGQYPFHLVENDINFNYFQLVHVNPGPITKPHRVRSVSETESNIVVKIAPVVKKSTDKSEITPGFWYYLLAIKRTAKPVVVEIVK